MDDPLDINQPLRAADVAAIAAIKDPVLRNLWITEAYANFSSQLRDVVDHADQTWCGFAVWASTTAGQSIRREELPAILARLLRMSDTHQASIAAVNDRYRRLRGVGLLSRLEDGHVVSAFDGALDAVSAHIAHGNTLVFSELAPLFVAFLGLVGGAAPGPVTPAALDDALDRAAGGPIDPNLRSAFHRYLVATTDGDPGDRARAVLAGNVLAVAHEQRRLQADIAAAVDAGLIDGEDLVGQLVPRWVPRVVVKVLTQPVRKQVEALLRHVWQEAATEMLMTLRVPGAVLHLSRPLSPLPGGELFPPELADLGDGDDAAPYREWDRTGGTGRHDGAHDWVVIRQRMSFIVNLFRSRQQDATLAVAPFTGSQVDAMRRGTVPPPPLLPPAKTP
jgi:hypothetical protein